MGEFLKVMQTFDYVLGLHNCLEFSQPSSWSNRKNTPASSLIVAVTLILQRAYLNVLLLRNLGSVYKEGGLTELLGEG